MIKITADDFFTKALNADNLIHNKAVKNASILEAWKVDETIYFQVGDAFSSTENIDNLTSVSENTIPSDESHTPGISPGDILPSGQ